MFTSAVSLLHDWFRLRYPIGSVCGHWRPSPESAIYSIINKVPFISESLRFQSLVSKDTTHTLETIVDRLIHFAEQYVPFGHHELNSG